MRNRIKPSGNTLTVHAFREKELKDHVLVRTYWCTGKNKRKAVDVKVTLSCTERLAVAELVAIRYLLSEAVAFSSKNRTGNGLTVVVSKGAIKKWHGNPRKKLNCTTLVTRS